MEQTGFNEIQLSILRQYQDAYRKADSVERRRKLKLVVKKFARMEKKIYKDLTEEEKQEIRSPIQLWFSNNCHTRSSGSKSTHAKKWNFNNVVVEEHKEEINKLTLQLSGETEAGKGRYIGLYQAAVKQVVGKLSEEQVEKYKKLVEEYNRTGPPKELQRKNADEHLNSTLRTFAKDIYRQFGAWLFILSAYVDPKETVSFSNHDFNDEIGGVKFTKTHPEWQEEGVYDEWEQYARESFQAEVPDAGDEDLSEHEIQDRRKQKADKVEVILETSDGIPILPAITADNMPKLPVLKSVIRTYLNKHYQNGTRDQKVSVPWSLITKDQNKFIDKKYLPVGFIIVEPSKITKANAQSLVLHWMERIDQNFDDIFEFKGLVPKIKTRRIRDRAHQKNALAQEIVKSDAEGDDEDSEEDDEEDEEESVEENSPPLPPPKQKSRPKPVARLAIDPAPVPAAHPTTHPTKPAPDQAAQPPKPKLDIREQAPADIGDDKKARRQFLHNLSGQDQYVKLLLALDNLPEEVSSSPDDVFWLPSWVSWQYSENHLPENIHKQKKHYFTMLKWLTLPPHQLRSGLLIDQNDAEMVLLGLGMILQDLERGRYSQDIEEPNPYPQFVLETIIEDDVMDDYVLEICSRFLSKIQSLDSTSGYQLASHINRKPRSPAKVKSMPDAIINSPRKRDLYPEADNREKKRQKKDDEVSERKTRAQRSKEARKTRSGKTIH